MKALFSSDWHLRSRPFPHRELSAEVIQLAVMGQIFDIFHDGDFGGIYVAGDVFDRYDESVKFLNWVVAELIGEPGVVHFIYGNHDLPVRNPYMEIGRSSLALLHRLGFFHHVTVDWWDDAVIVGENFGETRQHRGTRLENEFRILMTHRPVFVETIPYWAPGAARFPHDLVDEYVGFDVVFVGDIHEPWVWVDGEVYRPPCDLNLGSNRPQYPVIVNCGGIFAEKPGEQKFVWGVDSGGFRVWAISLEDPGGWMDDRADVRKISDTVEVERVIQELEDMKMERYSFWEVFRELAGDPALVEYTKKLWEDHRGKL